jgi:hypothetical protein
MSPALSVCLKFSLWSLYVQWMTPGLEECNISKKPTNWLGVMSLNLGFRHMVRYSMQPETRTRTKGGKW